MTSMLVIKNWAIEKRRALGATEIVSGLSRIDGWKLTGDGADVAIEKTFGFANYFETIAFVNALALIAHRQDHHPDLSVHYNRCVVRFNTHDVAGISQTDLDCATQANALLAAPAAA
ncbi:4a-hydroxytetrahydrobiopterin dehydratase [Variovorax sp. RHLX14]|uniref:4a-hydroxytetrahydrobiopterin dehydratase n=1 Tax=Variovorax sp. RHLX14 TaxID=1259731 RepID=UPI003F470F37